MKRTRKAQDPSKQCQVSLLHRPASLQPGGQVSHGIYCCPSEEGVLYSPPLC